MEEEAKKEGQKMKGKSYLFFERTLRTEFFFPWNFLYDLRDRICGKKCGIWCWVFSIRPSTRPSIDKLSQKLYSVFRAQKFCNLKGCRFKSCSIQIIFFFISLNLIPEPLKMLFYSSISCKNPENQPDWQQLVTCN